MTTADAITLKDLAGARVGVVGAGRTGLAVIEALTGLGARIHLLDARRDAADAVTAPLERVTLGDDRAQADALDRARPDLLIVSPGVPATGPVLARARRDGIRVWSEIELAWRFQQATRPEVPWIVVTGTDGKTTTVGMLAAILTAAGLDAPAVGNIGSPTITTVLEGRADAMAVELSSFQLHTTRTLSPLAAACLNLAPDHLDWHGGMEAYRADKARVYARARQAAGKAAPRDFNFWQFRHDLLWVDALESALAPASAPVLAAPDFRRRFRPCLGLFRALQRARFGAGAKRLFG